MLTQMKAFEGVFIASTNLLDGFDQAVLRRFDLTLKFDYLCADQAWMLLCRQARALGLPQPLAVTLARLVRIHALTLGDYAAVVRRHRFYAGRSAEAFVTALEEECALKEDRAQRMGFVWVSSCCASCNINVSMGIRHVGEMQILWIIVIWHV